MASEFREIRRDITFFLGSLRQTVDRIPWRRSKDMEVERENFTRIMLYIEEARVRFNSYVRNGSEPNAKEWLEVRELLNELFLKLWNEENQNDILLGRKFRPYPPLFRDKERPTPFIEYFITRDNDILEHFPADRNLFPIHRMVRT